MNEILRNLGIDLHQLVMQLALSFLGAAVLAAVAVLVFVRVRRRKK